MCTCTSTRLYVWQIFTKIYNFFTGGATKASASKATEKSKAESLFASNADSDFNSDLVLQNQNEKYKQIEDLCIEYRISPEEARTSHLLEKIAGCTSEELAKMSDDEFKNVINALKSALKRDFKLFFLDRDTKDLADIAKCANEQYVRKMTGGSWFGQKIDNLFSSNSLILQSAQ